ncbi:MAG: hypothetical protein CM15mP128_5460 [Methanobacteriota archaeon]|nr:MAG: hypothetical protein CM15mP128_5460 [Euryarchaeota archaeon]
MPPGWGPSTPSRGANPYAFRRREPRGETDPLFSHPFSLTQQRCAVRQMGGFCSSPSVTKLAKPSDPYLQDLHPRLPCWRSPVLHALRTNDLQYVPGQRSPFRPPRDLHRHHGPRRALTTRRFGELPNGAEKQPGAQAIAARQGIGEAIPVLAKPIWPSSEGGPKTRVGRRSHAQRNGARRGRGNAATDGDLRFKWPMQGPGSQTAFLRSRR